MIGAKNVQQALKKRSVFMYVAALSAGTDLADHPLFRMPCAGTIVGLNFIPQGDDAGIDAGNTSVWLFEVGSTALGTVTFDGDPAFPNKGVVGAAVLDVIANRRRLEGDIVTVSITNGATAAIPACVIEVEYIIDDKSQFDDVHSVN